MLFSHTARALLVLSVAGSLWGCASLTQGRGDRGVGPAATSQTPAVTVRSQDWVHDNADSAVARIDRRMQQLAADGIGRVLFQVLPGQPGRDPGAAVLTRAVEAAHREGLEMYAVVDLPTGWDQPTQPATPDPLARAKSDESIARYLEAGEIRKVVYVPGRLLSLVVS